MLAIRERIFQVFAVWATTLSKDLAQDMDVLRKIFGELGAQLEAKDRGAYESLVRGYESLLFAPPTPKPTISPALQEWLELAGEVRNQRSKPPAPKAGRHVPDGLDGFLT